MTAKEKAKDLVNRFFIEVDSYYVEDIVSQPKAKQCALVCVDEIELYREQIEDEYNEDLYHAYGVEEYWQEVKQEINKLC